jgi:ATP-binding cassette subfamily B protein
LIARLRKAFGHIPPTLGLVWSSGPRGLLGYVALALVGAGAPLGVAYGGKRILDAVVARDPAQALRWVAAEGALVALVALVLRGQGLLRSVLGGRLGVDINTRILEKAITLGLPRFEDPEFYDRMTRARREASSRPIGVVSDVFLIAQSALSLLGYVALLASLGPWAILGMVLASVPATLAEVRFSNQQFRLRNRRAPESRKLSYLEYVLANDAHAKEVKLFGLGLPLLDRYRTLAEKIFREDTDLGRRRALWGYLLSLLSVLAFYGCYAALALGAIGGRLSLGDLVMYAAAFRQGQQSFQAILNALGGMYEDNLYMSNLFEFLALPPESSPPAPHRLSRRGEERGSGLEGNGGDGIRLEGVGFRYPGQERWTLRGIDLHVPPGDSLALVGQNGSGKTTLIKLITGLYRPTEGRVLLDGRDLHDWPEEELRGRIGVIFQDFNRYQLTLRENVGVGSFPHADDEDRVRQAIDRAGAGDVLQGLEQGLAADLGRWFHSRGVELSGGQWQRVALARAYMREEADILILDEPTAALDAEAEAAVYQRFRELAAGRTTILISHRFPTVRGARRIVVLEQGQVAESGNHEQLMALEGRYARLFRLQAQGYL